MGRSRAVAEPGRKLRGSADGRNGDDLSHDVDAQVDGLAQTAAKDVCRVWL